MTPRGIRNNNPCNIRQCRSIYAGEIRPSQDREFKQFRTAAFGYRAAFVLLEHYYVKLGLKTLRKMLNRWAPPTENNTDSYIRHVSVAAGCSPDQEIDITNRALMVKVVSAMSKIENGLDAVDSDVDAGWDLYRTGRP